MFYPIYSYWSLVFGILTYHHVHYINFCVHIQFNVFL